MTIIIIGVIIVIKKIPAVNIVDIAIIIIIHTTDAMFFSSIPPDVISQVGMRIINAAVNHRDHQIGVSRCNIPRFGKVHIGVCDTVYSIDILTGIMKTPLKRVI